MDGILGTVIDALVDGAYTGMSTLLGYMAGTGGPVIPSKAAFMLAGATGFLGFLNQLRALRKQPR
jgi:hypothetical protein